MLKLMANFQVFQTIYHTNFCISTGIKTTANFLITDIETASFFASHCMFCSKVICMKMIKTRKNYIQWLAKKKLGVSISVIRKLAVVFIPVEIQIFA